MIEFILGAVSASLVWMFFWPDDKIPQVWIQMTKNVTKITKSTKSNAPQTTDDSEATGSQSAELTEGSKKVEVDGAQTESSGDARSPAEEETGSAKLGWRVARTTCCTPRQTLVKVHGLYFAL